MKHDPGFMKFRWHHKVIWPNLDRARGLGQWKLVDYGWHGELYDEHKFWLLILGR